MVERAVIKAIRTGHLCFEIEEPGNVPETSRIAPINTRLPSVYALADSASLEGDDVLSLEDMERRHILRAIERSGGKIMGKNSAAEFLNINGYTLRKKMMRLGLDPRKQRAAL